MQEQLPTMTYDEFVKLAKRLGQNGVQIYHHHENEPVVQNFNDHSVHLIAQETIDRLLADGVIVAYSRNWRAIKRWFPAEEE